MTPSNVEHSNSVSICDIHRLDTTFKDNSDGMTMKIMSKYGANPLRCSLLRKGFCGENHSCRSHSSNDKQKTRLDSLFDERAFEASTSDKGCVFPKEKFYGNAQLLLTMNDDILRKTVIDCDDDSYGRHVDSTYNFHRKVPSVNRFTKDDGAARQRSIFSFKNKPELTRDPAIIPTPADNKMIDDYGEGKCKAAAEESVFLSQNREKCERHSRVRKQTFVKEQIENDTQSKAFAKSSSFPISFQVAQYSLGVERMESSIARDAIKKSVSTLSFGSERASKENSRNEL